MRIEAPSQPPCVSLMPNVLSISGSSRPSESVGSVIAQLAAQRLKRTTQR